MDNYWQSARKEQRVELKVIEGNKPKADDHIKRFKEWFGEDVPVVSAQDYGEVTFIFQDKDGAEHKMTARHGTVNPGYPFYYEYNLGWSIFINGFYHSCTTQKGGSSLLSACENALCVKKDREEKGKEEQERREAIEGRSFWDKLLG